MKDQRKQRSKRNTNFLKILKVTKEDFIRSSFPILSKVCYEHHQFYILKNQKKNKKIISTFTAKNNLIWYGKHLTLILKLENNRKKYENDSRIKFLLNSEFYENNPIVVIEIDENGIAVFSTENKTGTIGWLNIPLYDENLHFVCENNYLKEKNSISFDICVNQFISYNFKDVKFQKTLFYLNILFQKEQKYLYNCKLIITRNESMAQQQNNIIFTKILDSQMLFSDEKIRTWKIQLISYEISLDSFINFNFIKWGIDFCESIYIEKNYFETKISIHSLNEKEEIMSTYDIPFLIKLNEIMQPQFSSNGSYRGSELRLKVDNAELILPEDCLNNKETHISIKRTVSIEKNDKNIQIFNSVECLPHDLTFEKPVKLKMKSPTNNPKILNSKKKPKSKDNNIFEQEIYHFSNHGIISTWDAENPMLKINYSFNTIKKGTVLVMTLSLSSMEIKTVSLNFHLIYLIITVQLNQARHTNIKSNNNIFNVKWREEFLNDGFTNNYILIELYDEKQNIIKQRCSFKEIFEAEGNGFYLK